LKIVIFFILNSGGFGKVFLVQDQDVESQELAAKFGAKTFKKEYKYMKKLEHLVSYILLIMYCNTC